mmetsp:Transcript_38032/g.126020  ORF Transcript_38032/g.126020 Transcript_38032/m.126020 type:complete len:278 (+) Transcript_38032:219-1052(+)
MCGPVALREAYRAVRGRYVAQRVRIHATRSDWEEDRSSEPARHLLDLLRTFPQVALWGDRAAEMPRAMLASSADGLALPKDGGADDPGYTLGAFAWGAVWLDSFAAALAHRETRAALGRGGGRKGGTAVVLGASLGYEAYAIGLSHGVRTVGVELLCSLRDLAEQVRSDRRVAPDLLSFECADALSWRLPKDTRLVYCDDTAWDAHAIQGLAKKLGDELPAGVVVLHNQPHGFNADPRFKLLQVVEVATSWNTRHPLIVHMTQPASSAARAALKGEL